jgi:hypothetical protein
MRILWAAEPFLGRLEPANMAIMTAYLVRRLVAVLPLPSSMRCVKAWD